MKDFSALNNFFDHIYVITLARAHERQKEIDKNLAGLNFEYFLGADKLEYQLSDLDRHGVFSKERSIQNHRYHKPLTIGQVCCAWSHKKVYEDMLSNGYQKILILEDDVIARSNINIIAPFIFKELPLNWELLYLDYNRNEKRNILKKYWYHVQKFLGKLTWSHTTIGNLYPKKINEHLASAGFHDFTSAYAITFNAAEKLLRLQTPISFVADNLLATACTSKIMNGYITIPKLFLQLSQGSGNLIDSLVTD